MKLSQSKFRKVWFGVLVGSSLIGSLVLSQLVPGQLSPTHANEINHLAQSSTPELPANESPTPASPPDAQSSQNLLKVLSSNNSFGIISQLIQASGLADTISMKGPYTLFAPTDNAFNDLPKGTLKKLLLPQNQEVLANILTYHLVVGKFDTSQIQPGQLPTVEGDSLTVKVDNAGKRIMVDKARVTQANIQASNGVIHAINKVLLPPGFKLSSLNS
ncbi:MAG: fasciclin domain-containing protein [Chroococcidiopsidaceae cyanobacterium CP_BM_ER_R8_30]|nr:fasciclin domain-containing protein [Chroococcidiopsidaceae cyanobacterium CP_BM_ER_R8_30]